MKVIQAVCILLVLGIYDLLLLSFPYLGFFKLIFTQFEGQSIEDVTSAWFVKAQLDNE